MYAEATQQPISERTLRFALDDSVHRYSCSWEERKEKKQAWNSILKRVNRSYAEQDQEEKRKQDILE
jgi:hypothetical protein